MGESESGGDMEMMTVAISSDGICDHDNGALVCDRDEAGPWEKFTLMPHPHGMAIFLSTHTGQFVSVQEDNSVTIDNEDPGTTEIFDVKLCGDNESKVAFRNSNGKYLSI